MKYSIEKMRRCLDLLSPPGGEVVTECLDEIELLRQQVTEAEKDRKLCYCCNSRLDQANDELYAREGKPTYEQLEKQLEQTRLKNAIVYGTSHPEIYKTKEDELRQQLADRDAEIQTIRNSPTMDAIRRVIETKLADENNELRQQVTLLRDAIEAELLGADYARRAMRKAFESTKEQ